MSSLKSRVLLVEGAEDKRVIPQLIEWAGIPWGSKNSPLVWIEDYDGVEKLLAPREIETRFKASERVSYRA
jgi:hypothetical protein